MELQLGGTLPSSHETVGPLLIGFALSCAVFGIFTGQVGTYYQRYFQDRLLYKMLVAILWHLQLLYLTFVGHATYYYTVTHYGKYVYLMTSPVAWTLIMQVMVSSIAGLIVKLAFMIRVWVFSKRNLSLTAVILILILAQLGFGIGYCIKAFQVKTLLRAHELKLIATLAFATGVATDIVIALALVYYLRKLRTGLKKSDSLVSTLSTYAINTGAVTSACSATTLILYNAWSSTLYFMGPYFVLGTLYTISFISTLNTRRVVRGRGTDNNESTTEKTRNAVFMIPTSKPHQSKRPSGGVVRGTSTRSNVEIGVRRELFMDVEPSAMKQDMTQTGESEKEKSGSPFR